MYYGSGSGFHSSRSACGRMQRPWQLALWIVHRMAQSVNVNEHLHLTTIISEVGPSLSSEYAQLVFDVVTSAIPEILYPTQLGSLSRAAQAVKYRLTKEQPAVGLASVLDNMGRHVDPYSVRSLRDIGTVIGERIAADQSEAALTAILLRLNETEERANIAAPVTIASTFNIDSVVANELTGLLLQAIQHETWSSTVDLLENAILAVAPKLLDDHKDVNLVVALDAMNKLTNPYQLCALAGVVQALEPNIQQRNLALSRILATSVGADGYELVRLASAAKALGIAREGADFLLARLREAAANAIDPGTRGAFTQAIETAPCPLHPPAPNPEPARPRRARAPNLARPLVHPPDDKPEIANARLTASTPVADRARIIRLANRSRAAAHAASPPRLVRHEQPSLRGGDPRNKPERTPEREFAQTNFRDARPNPSAARRAAPVGNEPGRRPAQAAAVARAGAGSSSSAPLQRVVDPLAPDELAGPASRPPGSRRSRARLRAGSEHAPDAGGVGGHHLLLDAADRQDQAAQARSRRSWPCRRGPCGWSAARPGR